MIETDRLLERCGTAPTTSRARLRVVTNGSGVGRIHFPTAAIAATALEPVLHQRGVSELAGCAGRSLDELVIEYQAAADAFRHRNDHQIAQTFGATAEANLGKCTGICS